MYVGVEIKDDIIPVIIKQLKNESLFRTTEMKEELIEIGKQRQETNRGEIKKNIDSFISINGIINADQVMKEWFPSIEADIFLSHSSKDEEDVHLIVGYFEKKLGLKVFVDSLVWGYSVDLLKELNNEYAKRNDGGYDYNSAMWLSSNVNLMLNTALNKMIDKTECLLFFNTPNSVSSSEGDKDQGNMSNSPWIYSELSMADTMRKNHPSRDLKSIREEFAGIEAVDEALIKSKFEYQLPDSLKKLKGKELEVWLSMEINKVMALDNLYQVLGLFKNGTLQL